MLEDVFVYGTLKPGHHNFEMCSSYVESYHEAEIDGDLYALGGIPAISKLGTGNIIKGYVLRVPPFILYGNFDRLEGHPNLYQRVRTTTISGEQVWVYVWATPGELEIKFPRIEHGDFDPILIDVNGQPTKAVPLEPINRSEEGFRILIDKSICRIILKKEDQ